MSSWTPGVFALSWVLLGCPEDHRRDGLVDRAAHTDALESIPKRCSDEERRMYCGAEGADAEEDCRRRCGDGE